ncbi:MAG: carboxypeptidase-like regulatory domain-containing protein [Edaphobacter sp.]
MKSRSLIALVVVLILGLGAGTPNLFAQGTDLGTIRGTVTDTSGAVIPNAQVEIMDLDTRTSKNFTTNGHGDYQAAALQGGNYQVTVTAPGFGTSVVKGVRLTGSDVVSANAVLRAAANATSVEVTSEAPLIDTTDQTLS